MLVFKRLTTKLFLILLINLVNNLKLGNENSNANISQKIFSLINNKLSKSALILLKEKIVAPNILILLKSV